LIGTRHEEYRQFQDGLPFVLYHGLERTKYIRSAENNWHENLELQFCTDGSGTVLLDGEILPIRKNDIVVVNSNVLHYTGTDSRMTYSCLIAGTDFCKAVGIDPQSHHFSPYIQSESMVFLMKELEKLYLDPAIPFRVTKLHKLFLEILTELGEHHTVGKSAASAGNKSFETVKSAVSYIRANYRQKLTLDMIAQAVLWDKYALCRDFKRLTGQTVIDHLNHYRCIMAIEYLSAGHTVSEAAELCGFKNLSFFSKIFKKHIGKLPSAYK